jgi:epoxyqueuosine reductase
MQPALESGEQRRRWASEVRGRLRGEDTQVQIGSATQRTALLKREPRQTVDLIWLLRLSHAEYLTAFRGTSIRRAKVWMLRRNAAVALGNVGTTACLAPLRDALTGDEHPLVRSHAAWALSEAAGRLGTDVTSTLRTALDREQDDDVCEEIRNALVR